MPEPTPPSAVLFDLDGTFADTAPDMAAALNRLLVRYDRPPVALEQARCHVSSGSRGMLAVGFGLVPGDPNYEALRSEYLDLYAADIHCDTCLFPGHQRSGRGVGCSGGSAGASSPISLVG